ncbi:MAG: hypothetical protein PVG66_16710 [Chromatiales bacterium]
MSIELIILLILVVLSSIFIVQNADVVEMRFLVWKLVMSRVLMYALLLFTGITVGWLLCNLL